MNKIVIISYFIFPIVLFGNIQNDYQIIDLLRRNKYDQAEVILREQQEIREIYSPYLLFQVKLHKEFDINKLEDFLFRNPKPLLKNNYIDRFYYLIANGDLQFHKYPDKDLEAISYYKSALEIAKQKKDKVLICEVLKKILYVHRISFLVDNSTYLTYLKMYKKYAYDILEKTYYDFYNLTFKFKNYYLDRWDKDLEFNLLSRIKDNNIPNYLKGKIFQLFGFYYELSGDYSKSNNFYTEAINYFKTLPYASFNYDIKTTFIYKAILEVNRNKLVNSLKYLKEAESDREDKIFTLNRMYISYWKSEVLYKQKKYKIAFDENKRYEYLRDSLEEFKYSTILTELEIKYQTAEKEKQILLEQQKSEKNRNLFIGAIGILFLVSLIAILLQKNTTKKQKLAEQQEEIQKQKIETLIKNQELLSIDAMILGQEKERQKVANELHDDLGSLMATVKLHFDNIETDKKNLALKKAKSLLEEAYQKVRGMAHSKHSGVIANQGLLPAVKKMAKTISNANKIKIEVHDFGLKERMENSLELTVFRVIQELLTNMIKHSDATIGSIHLTQHEDSLNVLVEDNGKGFDISKIRASKEGMGLLSIEKRIENLEGNFTIDSIVGRGTSIIIDIPV
ncbi:MAG: ATP-binding protein [Cellulophaga sp.]